MNPIDLSAVLAQRVASYLRTTFYFSDPDLRESFRGALEEGGIHRGPFLEKLPNFARGCPPEDLPGGAALRGILGDLPLYRHQELAARSLLNNRNAIIATPTGSGKTEAYLLPIILTILKDPRPGVRALILYPMNALANDQRKRLGDYAGELAKSGIQLSFGRYTGQTPESASDNRRNASAAAQDRKPGELVYRDEMRHSPPHILLTNFSMLEYLLLRPEDSPLFETVSPNATRFLVLDEAHQYRGAKGIEMAYLMRRLKQRLGTTRTNLRCVATSASLGRGKQDLPALAAFAETLFGEEFDPRDAIIEESAPQPSADPEGDRLKHALQEPKTVEALALELFPEANGGGSEGLAIAALERALGKGELRIRYHLFIRALEGAFLQLWPRRQLAITKGAPASTTDSGPWFELALCRECGQHYYVGREQNGRLLEPDRDRSSPDFGVEYFLPLPQNEGLPDHAEGRYLCGHCAAIWRVGAAPACPHPDPARVARFAPSATHEDRLSKCAACGYSGPDPVREVVHGADAPNSAIATALFQNLPEGRRKILAFADGRQEAAFFAWFAEHSYTGLLEKNLLVRAAKNARLPSSPATIVDHLAPLLSATGAAPRHEDQHQVGKRAWRIAYREFSNSEPRLSPEGVGILRWQLAPEVSRDLCAALAQQRGDVPQGELAGLIQVLVDSLRSDCAFNLETNLTAPLNWMDLELNGPQNLVDLAQHAGTKGAKKRFNVVAWEGDSGFRHDFSAKAGVSKDFMSKLWGELQRSGVLTRPGSGWRLDPRLWRLTALSPDATLYACKTCRRVQHSSVRRCCSRPRCSGELEPTTADANADNHYRRLYEADLPAGFRAEEHTAQLTPEKAAKYQAEFTDGTISLLSSSTTFELGVDLGDLDLVFLRNVPPEPFNYAQRVGRAGRRSGRPGFAVVYCRRAPHDLACFQDSLRTISGKTSPPVLRIKNRKIAARHAVAVILSSYFRANRHTFGNVRSFFGDPPAALQQLQAFIASNQATLAADLDQAGITQLLPPTEWVEAAVGADSQLALTQLELHSDMTNLRSLENQASSRGDHRAAQRAVDRLKTILDGDVLSYLSARAVIPKYGFPVDVVTLEPPLATSARGVGVELARDLSIAVAEFAPGSELIANKKIWTSVGLKRVIAKEWHRSAYWRCQHHGAFSLGPPKPCCSKMQQSEFVSPQFGFVADTSTKNPTRKPERLFATRPFFAGFDNPGQQAFTPCAALSVEKASPGKLVVLCEGRKGRGFLICPDCGAETDKLAAPHRTPLGAQCAGKPSRPVALGHEFLTDVLSATFQLPDPPCLDGRIPAWSTAFSLLYGAAEVLEVPSPDINVTVAAITSREFRVVLYDSVPGGAGLVAQLERPDILRRAIRVALERVNGKCKCAENTSCQGCLRSYHNQFAHAWLVRGEAYRVLKTTLDSWAGSTTAAASS